MNRTYGTAFGAGEIGSMMSRLKERGTLVEIRPWVYRFELGDHRDKMAR